MPLHTYTKIKLLIGFFLSLFFSSMAQNEDIRLDSTYSFQFTSAQDSMPVNKAVCSFSTLGNTDACYNFSSCISSSWEAQTRIWTPYTKQERRWEEEGKKVSDITYSFHTNTQTWRPLQRNFWIKVNNVEEINTYVWDTLATNWLLKHVRQNVFDAEGRTLYQDNKSYDPEERTWQGSQETHAFDEAGRVIEYAYANWAPEKNDWLPEQKYTQSYTSAGFVAEKINYYWEAQSRKWETGTRKNYSYNVDNQLILREESTDNYKRIEEYTYNDQGQEIFYQRSSLVNFFTVLQVEVSRSQSYDASGNLLVRETHKWNNDSLFLEIYDRKVYSYNSLNQLILLKEYERDWQTQSFYMRQEESYVYTSSGEVAQLDKYTFDEQENRLSGSRDEYSYDDLGRRVVRIISYWNTDKQDWVPTRKNENPYGIDGRVSCYAWFQWDEPSEIWKVGSKSCIDYNETGTYTRSYRAFWRPQQGDWFISSSVNLYYGACRKENLLPERAGSLLLYPNPVSDSRAFIETELERPFVYEVLDLQGRKVLGGEMNALVNPLNLKELKDGAYFMRCTSEGKSEIMKFLVAKN